MATLVAFALCLEATAHDDALEVLEALLRDLFSNAEKADKKARMRSLKDLDRSAATLAAACKVVLDSSISDDNVRARLFNDLPRTTLEKALEEVNALIRPVDDVYFLALKRATAACAASCPTCSSTSASASARPARAWRLVWSGCN